MDHNCWINKDQIMKVLYTFNKQGGKNHFWDTNSHNQFVQFFYQLNRIQHITHQHNIMSVYKHLLTIFNDCNKEKTLLYKLIAFTRDIYCGKGEYYLSYLLVYTFCEFETNNNLPNYENVYNIINAFVGYKTLSTNKKQLKKPLGSWKDVKGILKMCYKHFPTSLTTSILEKYLIKIVNSQLKSDIIFMKLNKECSLLGKWIPREKKIFKAFYRKLVLNYYTLKNDEPNIYYYLKKYRKLLSSLNKYVNTIEINFCEHTRKNIDIAKAPKKAILNYSLSLLNINKKGQNRKTDINWIDKFMCKKNFENYLLKQNLNSNAEKILLKNTFYMEDHLIIKYALLNLNKKNKDYINFLWEHNKKLRSTNENYLPIVDISESLKQYSISNYCACLAIAIRISEISNLKNRLLCFSEKPFWVNTTNLSLTEILEKIQEIKDDKKNKILHANIENVFNLLVDHIKISKLNLEEKRELTFFIISNMDFYSITEKNELLIPYIKNKFNEIGTSYEYDKLPHIVFWNTECENYFVGKGDEENISFLSGYNPTICNWIKNKKNINTSNTSNTSNTNYYTCPYYKMVSILNQPRYSVFNLA